MDKQIVIKRETAEEVVRLIKDHVERYTQGDSVELYLHESYSILCKLDTEIRNQDEDMMRIIFEKAVTNE